MNKVFHYLPFCALFFCQCTPSKPTEEETEAAKPSVSALPIIETQTAQRKTFQLLLLSNGRISNQNASKIGFKTSGVIAQINVQNGTAVRAGQLLAQLENREQLLAMRQAELQIAEARIEINDLLISCGVYGFFEDDDVKTLFFDRLIN